MSLLPDVRLSVEDGALGVLSSSPASVHVKLGVCSKGKPHTLLSFSRMNDLSEALGTGPLVEAAAYALSVAGGPLYVMPIRPSIEGKAGEMQVTRARKDAQSTGTLTVEGTPLDGYAVQVTLVQTGTVGESPCPAFQVSLDGGATQSLVRAVPSNGSFLVEGTGLTLKFEGNPAEFHAGDRFTFHCQAPSFGLQDLTEALQALGADPRLWGFLHLVGTPGGDDEEAQAQAFASLLATVGLWMQQASKAHRFARTILEAPRVSDKVLLSTIATKAEARVMVAAGYATLVSPLTGQQALRSAAWPMAARAASVRLSEDLARLASGPLSGVVSLDRDEERTPGLDAQRIATLRTLLGWPGFYITNPNVLAPMGSDFLLWQYGRVMDEACSLARQALLPCLHEKLRVDSKTGFLEEKEALSLERRVEGQLRAALVQPGEVADVGVHVNRTDNLLSTRTLRVAVRVLPFAYAKFIEVSLGFKNPALTPSES